VRTLTALSELGAIIAPPVPAFHAKLDDMVEHAVGRRMLDLFDIDITIASWRARCAETPSVVAAPRSLPDVSSDPRKDQSYAGGTPVGRNSPPIWPKLPR
jgi:hypothetical protein